MKERASSEYSTPHEEYYDWVVPFTASTIVDNQSGFEFLMTDPSYAHYLARAIERDDTFGELLRESAPGIVNEAFEIASSRPVAAPDEHPGSLRWVNPSLLGVVPDLYRASSDVIQEQTEHHHPRFNPDALLTSVKSAPPRMIGRPSSLGTVGIRVTEAGPKSVPESMEVSPDTTRERYEYLRSQGASPEKAMSAVDDLTANRFEDGSMIAGIDSIEAPETGIEPPSL